MHETARIRRGLKCAAAPAAAVMRSAITLVMLNAVTLTHAAPPDASVDDGAIILYGAVRTQPPSVLRDAIGVVAIGARAGVIRSNGSLALWGPMWATFSSQASAWPDTSPPASPMVAAADHSDSYWLALCADGSLAGDGLTAGGAPVSAWPALPDGVVFTQVAATAFRAIALRSDGVVVSWPNIWSAMPSAPPGLKYTSVAGFKQTGILALRNDGAIIGSTAAIQAAVPPLPPGTSYQLLAAGPNQAIALRSDNTLVAWGTSNPVMTNAPGIPRDRTVIALSSGNFHAVALLDDGSLLMWGDSVAITPEPPLPEGMGYVAVAAGEQQVVALRSDGRAVCFGAGYESMNNGHQLPDGVKYDALAIGDSSAGGADALIVAAADDGSLHVWGSYAPFIIPPPSAPAGTLVVDLMIGGNSACMLCNDGSITCWGLNSNGQLNVPPLPEGVRYEQIANRSMTSNYTAIRSDGEIVVWPIPDAAPPLPEGVVYSKIRAGYGHRVAMRSDDEVVAWGSNSYGQCDVPPLDSGLTWVDIDATYLTSVGLVNDGTIRCWGQANPESCAAPPPHLGETYDALIARTDFAMRFGALGTVDIWGHWIAPYLDGQPKPPPGTFIWKRVYGNGTVGAILRAIPKDACLSDLSGNRIVDGEDLGALLGLWGTNSTLADFNHDGVVDGADLGELLGAWGPCPPKGG